MTDGESAPVSCPVTVPVEVFKVRPAGNVPVAIEKTLVPTPPVTVGEIVGVKPTYEVTLEGVVIAMSDIVVNASVVKSLIPA